MKTLTPKGAGMFVRNLIVAMALVSSVSSFAAGNCKDGVAGRYVNPVYNGKYAYQKAYVDIQDVAAGSHQMEISIPCGTKLRPSTVELTSTSCISGNFRVVDQGSSQCFLGETGEYLLLNDELVIYPEKRIWVPGFDGVYRFNRE